MFEYIVKMFSLKTGIKLYLSDELNCVHRLVAFAMYFCCMIMIGLVAVKFVPQSAIEHILPRKNPANWENEKIFIFVLLSGMICIWLISKFLLILSINLVQKLFA